MPLAPPPPPLRLSTRPALALAVALAAGIAAAGAWPRVGVLAWAGVASAAAVGLAAYVLATRQRLVTLRPLAWSAAALGVAFAAGGAREAAVREASDHSIARLAVQGEAPTTVWGTVASVPQRTWAVRMEVDLDSVARGDLGRPVDGRVQASLTTPREGVAVYPVLRPGDRVRLTGRLEGLPRPRNPAQMDYGAYLQRQGVSAMLEVEDEAGAVFLSPSRRPVTRLAQAARDRVRRAMARWVPSAETRALLAALLLADRSAIDASTLDAFRETGLMHLLAVSGLHVGLVGLALYALLKPLLGRLGVRRRRVEWARAAVTLSVLGLYVVVAGASVSVVRAFVMVTVLILGRAVERSVDTLSALGLAAILLLAHRPSALFDVGFQLSFGAVAALVTLTPWLNAAVPARVRQSAVGMLVAGSVTTSLAATAGTAPALLAHFGRLPLGGLVLNLPAIPLTALTLGGGLGCALTSPVPPLAAAFGAVAEVGGRGLLWVTEAGAAGFGWAVYDGFLESPAVLVASVLVLAALAMGRRPVARRRLAMAAAASVAVGLWAGVARGESAPVLNAVFLDVGQGDATLVTTPSGRAVLIDAGLRSPYVDEGERTVLPHLQRYGVRRLDALVLTHADADHIGGAAALLRSVPVGRLVVNGAGGESDLWREVVATADSLGVPVQAARAGDTLAVDPAVRLRVLGPAGRGGVPGRPPAAASPPASPNDASVVLLLEHGRTRWLLTGDAETAGEAALVDAFRGRLRADVVKVGHHGSRTSSTPALVAAAGRPSFAVVSVAARNRYGLPDEEPLARWAATGARVLLTSREGAVWLQSDGKRVRRVDWRSR